METTVTVKQLQDMQHAIGYDIKSVKKGVYEPYRNFFSVYEPNESWEELIKKGYACKFIKFGSIIYQTTKEGRNMLSEVLGVKILEESK